MTNNPPAHSPSPKFNSFGINRLALVNSGGFCYCEIPLDDHALLLGEGNKGKSSLLNSLRLFLLPESNFKNSRNKFAFRNSKTGGYYSNEEAYEHYFPASYSFLVLEVTNPAGTHCQILYRDQANRLSYNRIFVPVPYDQLRALFWRFEEDPDGIGYASNELNVRRVLDVTKSLSSDTETCNDSSRLKTLLYSSDLVEMDNLRYSVLPLSGDDPRKVQSLRTLIILLFEMKTDDAALANALASIIEADKKYASDELNLNISEFFARHDELKTQEQHLIKIERQRPAFESLLSRWETFWEKKANQHALVNFDRSLSVRLDEVKTALQQTREDRDTKQEAVSHINGKIKQAEGHKNEHVGARKHHAKTLQKKQEIKNAGDLLVARYPSMPRSEIKDTLEDDLSDAQQSLEALNSESAAQSRISKLQTKLEKLKEQLSSTVEREQTQEWQLQNQLPDAVAAPLAAVNPELLTASSGENLDEQTKDVIEAFSSLFTSTDSGFKWFDLDLPSRTVASEDLGKKAARLRKDIKANEAELNDLTTPSQSTEERRKKIKATQSDIKEFERSLETLSSYEGVENAIKDAEEGLRYADEMIEEADNRIEKLTETRDEKDRILKDAEKRVHDMYAQQTALIELEKSVAAQRRRVEDVSLPDELSPIPSEQLTPENLEEIVSGLDEMDKSRSEIGMDVRDFWHQQILGQEHSGLIHHHVDLSQIEAAVNALKEIFEGLHERQEVLVEQIRTHNEAVASYQQALRANAEHIQRFEDQINRELSGVTVNDLTEIRMDIHVNEKFKTLVAESEAINPHSGNLASDAFYDRLSNFANNFFDRSDYSLRMEDLIEGVSYRTRKADSEVLESKSQSNSSTALINLELVHRLLKRVLYPGAEMSIPMVLDELASVDKSQIPSVLNRLSSQGFKLFAAATYSASPEVIYIIGRHLGIDQMRTAYPYDKKRNLVYWGGTEGFPQANDVTQWVDQSQANLF